MPEPIPTLDDVAAIMALTANEGAAAAFAATDALAQRLFGHNLFTVTRSLHDTMEVERAYSSNPAAYPLGGRKQKQDTHWGHVVLDRGEMMVCDTPDDIRRVFADHELILSLGITTMVNVPILYAGRSLVTINISHATRRWGTETHPGLRILAGLLTASVM